MLIQISNRLPVLYKSIFDRKLDATEMLTKDHVKFETYFMQLKFMTRIFKSVPSRRADIRARSHKLFATIRTELEKHMLAEELVFYPECEKLDGLEGTIDHAREAHDDVKNLMIEMSKLPIDDSTYNSRLSELVKNVMQHTREEEEEIFPVVRKALSKSRLDRLASQMRNVKKGKQAKAA